MAQDSLSTPGGGVALTLSELRKLMDIFLDPTRWPERARRALGYDVPMTKRHPRSDDERVLRQIERLGAVASGVSSLEYLFRPQDRTFGGLNHWPPQRRRVVSGDVSPTLGTRILDRIGAESMEQLLHAARLASVAVLAFPVRSSLSRLIANLVLSASGAALAPKHFYGSEGSDHVTIVVHALCGIGRASARHRADVLDAIAVQGALSYGASGLGKLAGDKWRSGTALAELSEARTYGTEGVARALREHPLLSRLITWTAVGAEIAAPVTLLAPPKLARVGVWAMRAFHLVNAVTMGLNRFFWAFAAFHPAMMRASRHADYARRSRRRRRGLA